MLRKSSVNLRLTNLIYDYSNLRSVPKRENEPFEFRIRVQDIRGNWSASESYP